LGHRDPDYSFGDEMMIYGQYPLSGIAPISDSLVPLFQSGADQGSQLGLGTDIVSTANPLVDQGIVSTIGDDLKNAVISFFDTLGQGYQKMTQPAFNQLIIIMVIVIGAIYFLGQSKIVRFKL
jgi:hypothetical protein